MQITEKTIDIDALLEQKMGEKARKVPRFLVRYLKRILHQDEDNEFLWQHRDEKGVQWLGSCTEFLGMNLEVEGQENLPAKDDGKRYTFVSNHPLGGQDGIAYGYLLGKEYDGKVRLVVNDLLMNLPGLAPLCIPVNTVARKSNRGTAEAIEGGFNSDNHMFFFPAGLCSRKIDGEIKDLPWRKTFLQKSIEHQRDIVPLHFSGHNSKRFYRIANVCKRLGLKVNIAMLYLPDEMYRNRGKTFKVTIGKPISWQTLKGMKTADAAEYVRSKVYEL